MRRLYLLSTILMVQVATLQLLGGVLPGRYFDLMASELDRLESSSTLLNSPSVMLAAAVLYVHQHPDNDFFGDEKMLDMALQVGDYVADESLKDPEEDRQHYEWEIHCWLDSYRLLEARLTHERRNHWRRALEQNVRWFEAEVDARIEFPRFQGPFIRTSTNHLAIFASTVYLAGRILRNQSWEDLGTRAMHRLASEEQSVDGRYSQVRSVDHLPVRAAGTSDHQPVHA